MPIKRVRYLKLVEGNKKMRKYAITALSIILMFSCLSIPAVAGSGDNGNGGIARGGSGVQASAGGGDQVQARVNSPGLFGLMSLELSEGQREQIRLMMQEHRELLLAEDEANREQRREQVQNQIAILEDEEFDELAAYDVLAEKAEMNLERQIIRMRLQHRILHEVLTEDQCLQLQNMWQNQAALGEGAGQGPGPGEGLGDCPYM